MKHFIGSVLVALALGACTERSPTHEAARPSSPAPVRTYPDTLEVTSCRELSVPIDREVNTNLDRKAGTLHFSYYVPRLNRDRQVTIRYRDDPWCRRNPKSRNLIFHAGAGKDIFRCIELPAQPPQGMTRVELWFHDLEDPKGFGTTIVVPRDIRSTDALAHATLEAWIEGPTREEKAAGALAIAPKGSELLGVEIDDGTATVDLSDDFERTGLGTTYEGAILDALAGTLTQFDSVGRGLLTIDGEFKGHYMGHGFIIDEQRPLTYPGRKRYRTAPTC